MLIKTAESDMSCENAKKRNEALVGLEPPSAHLLIG